MQLFMNSIRGVKDLSLMYGYFKLLDGTHSTERDVYAVAKGTIASIATLSLSEYYLTSPLVRFGCQFVWRKEGRTTSARQRGSFCSLLLAPSFLHNFITIPGVYFHKTGRVLMRTMTQADANNIALVFRLTDRGSGGQTNSSSNDSPVNTTASTSAAAQLTPASHSTSTRSEAATSKLHDRRDLVVGSSRAVKMDGNSLENIRGQELLSGERRRIPPFSSPDKRGLVDHRHDLHGLYEVGR